MDYRPPYTQTDIALDGLRFARERGVSIIAFRSVMCERMGPVFRVYYEMNAVINKFYMHPPSDRYPLVHPVTYIYIHTPQNSGDRILCEKMDATIASVTTQHEPMPEVAPVCVMLGRLFLLGDKGMYMYI